MPDDRDDRVFPGPRSIPRTAADLDPAVPHLAALVQLTRRTETTAISRCSPPDRLFLRKNEQRSRRRSSTSADDRRAAVASLEAQPVIARCPRGRSSARRRAARAATPGGGAASRLWRSARPAGLPSCCLPLHGSLPGLALLRVEMRQRIGRRRSAMAWRSARPPERSRLAEEQGAEGDGPSPVPSVPNVPAKALHEEAYDVAVDLGGNEDTTAPRGVATAGR